MEYVKLGQTGLDVSPLCLGTMSFGDPNSWIHKWTLNEEDSRVIIQKSLELGINFFDTANVYSLGGSEEILGRALKDYASRDDIVIATKVSEKMSDRPNGKGLSRKAILSQIDHSLKRLQTDYVDLYIVHRWDPLTPIEETMEALHDVVKSGKARYIGASSMHAYQFQKANNTAKENGWTSFVSMQNHLNLIYREEEREMLPYCQDQGIAITPYSPLASGRLVKSKQEVTKRGETDFIQRMKYDAMMTQDQIIIDRVAQLAKKYHLSQTDIALSWLLQKEGVISPVVGATKIDHITAAVGALDVTLSKEDIHFLEEPYVAHPVVGFNS